MKNVSWGLVFFISILSAIIGYGTTDIIIHARQTANNKDKILKVESFQDEFENSFRLLCSSKEGFNKTLKECENIISFINQYHTKDFEKDGWVNRRKPNYNGYIWNTTPTVMEAYYRDAFVIWCMSGVTSKENGLGETRGQCIKLYRCTETKVSKFQGWQTTGDDKCD